MKTANTLGIFTIGTIFTFAILAISLTVYGLYLAATVSFFAAILVLLIEPAPLVIALIYLATGKNIVQLMFDFLTK